MYLPYSGKRWWWKILANQSLFCQSFTLQSFTQAKNRKKIARNATRLQVILNLCVLKTGRILRIILLTNLLFHRLPTSSTAYGSSLALPILLRA